MDVAFANIEGKHVQKYIQFLRNSKQMLKYKGRGPMCGTFQFQNLEEVNFIVIIRCNIKCNSKNYRRSTINFIWSNRNKFLNEYKQSDESSKRKTKQISTIYFPSNLQRLMRK